MTEAPKIGFLCTGKTPLELAVSIHCQSKMSPVLTEAGYAVGGCYTEIFDGSGPEKIKRAGKTLEYLCRSNDAVFTLGCEGFSAGDVIPELTEVVSPEVLPILPPCFAAPKSFLTQTSPLRQKSGLAADPPAATVCIPMKAVSAIPSGRARCGKMRPCRLPKSCAKHLSASIAKAGSRKCRRI